MALAIIGKNLKSFGFEEINFHEPLDFEEVTVSAGTDLILLAKALELDYEEIQILNPEVLRWFIPDNIADYNLRLPVGFKERFQVVAANQLDQFQALEFQKYKVAGKNVRIADVAKRYKLKDYVLQDLNKNLSKKSALAKGTEVILPFRVGQKTRDPMYADLYELPRKEVVRKNAYKAQITKAKKNGKKISSPKEYYTVRKGDTLWTVARKNGISLDNLIVSNLSIINSRMIRAGDKLVIR